LDLGATRVTDAGLKGLAGLTQLKNLYLQDTNVTDDGLKYLRGLKQLQSLDLNGTKVTARGIQELRQALPDCLIEPSSGATPPAGPQRPGPKASVNAEGVAATR
jgi:hypothetical protein